MAADRMVDPIGVIRGYGFPAPGIDSTPPNAAAARGPAEPPRADAVAAAEADIARRAAARAAVTPRPHPVVDPADAVTLEAVERELSRLLGLL